MRNLIRDIAERWRVPPHMLPDIAPEAEDALRSRFAQHHSARQLAREVQVALAAGIRLSNHTLN